jgi:ABC-type amino acid transport system permease subunit
VIGLTVNYSAYLSEVYRAGIQAVAKGQVEAALSLGLSRAKMMRLVILPQALRIVVPPLGNYFISLFKDTALCLDHHGEGADLLRARSSRRPTSSTSRSSRSPG